MLLTELFVCFTGRKVQQLFLFSFPFFFSRVNVDLILHDPAQKHLHCSVSFCSGCFPFSASLLWEQLALGVPPEPPYLSSERPAGKETCLPGPGSAESLGETSAASRQDDRPEDGKRECCKH